MKFDREEIRNHLQRGFTPEQVGGGRREVHRAALEEQARLANELGAFAPTPENVARLRDERALRWEAISARVFGDANHATAVKRLYDEARGEGAARRSWTGRGRRFPDMRDTPTPSPRTSSANPPELLKLGTAPLQEARNLLRVALHSDAFFVDGDHIHIALPASFDSTATRLVMTRFRFPPQADAVGRGRDGLFHAVAADLTALCSTRLMSVERAAAGAQVGCRACRILEIAAEIAADEDAPPPLRVEQETHGEALARYLSDQLSSQFGDATHADDRGKGRFRLQIRDAPAGVGWDTRPGWVHVWVKELSRTELEGLVAALQHPNSIAHNAADVSFRLYARTDAAAVVELVRHRMTG